MRSVYQTLTVPNSNLDGHYTCERDTGETSVATALENANLADLKSWLRVRPFTGVVRRRGRFVPREWYTSEESNDRDGVCSELLHVLRLSEQVGAGECRVEAARRNSRDEQQHLTESELRAQLEYRLRLRVTEEIERQMMRPIERVNRRAEDPLANLEAWSGKCITSFALVNICTVVDKYLLWRRVLPRVDPFYALKANPDPAIAATLCVLDAGFDCASRAELEQVLDLPGMSPSSIIFANPCKQVEHILYAKERGVSLMTFDNVYELEKIVAYYPHAQLVLRLLPDDSHSLMPFGAKFGASFSECRSLLSRSRQLGANVIGTSFHVGSGCYSSVAWIEALKLSRRIFDEALSYGYRFSLLDIGGGFPGTEDGELTLCSIGPDINATIAQLFPPEVRIIAEPGRFFCTEAVVLACRIISKRKRIVSGDNNSPELEHQYYLTDGIYGSMNCVVFDHAKLSPSLLASDLCHRPIHRTTMWGPTCDSIDVLVKGILFPEANVGEWIYFRNMGAYTTSAASLFNGFPKPTPIYVSDPSLSYP